MSEHEDFSSAAVLRKARQYIAKKKNIEYLKRSESTIKEFISGGFTTRDIVVFYKEELNINISLDTLEEYIKHRHSFFYKDAKKKSSKKDNNNSKDNAANQDDQQSRNQDENNTTSPLELREDDTQVSPYKREENKGYNFNETQEDISHAS